MEHQLEELINTYGEKLLRYATSILYNHQDAEDVVQDVFLTVYRKGSIDEHHNLSAWLYKITYNKSINIIRRRKFLVFGNVPENTVAPKRTGFSEEMLHGLGLLKPEERALLYGRILEGYSYQELSEQMGKSEAALRKRYERAKLKLAKHLKSYYPQKGESNEQPSIL